MNQEPGAGHAHDDRSDDRVPHVVVGVDGSAGSREALAYALVTAARRGADVEVVSAYPLPLPWAGGAPVAVPDPTALRRRLEQTVRGVVDDVRADPAVVAATGGRPPDVVLFVSEGPAAPVLLERSRDADLLVVGSRGRGAVRSVLLGSVALHCATGASCPVLVVPHRQVEPAGPPVVVVGVDGSAPARAALRAAVEEARRLRATVDAVAAYDAQGRWTDVDEQVAPSFAGFRTDVERGAAQLVEEVLADVAPPTPVVRVVVVEGPPAETLVSRSHEAQLLVVGDRGRGGIAGLLLGSVALRCLASAACPVLVVPGEDAPAPTGSERVRATAVPA